ncbi:MAG: HDOD domain-containing protein [Thiobacillus sp.]
MEALPNNLNGWLSYLSRAEIPVLKQTARSIDRLRPMNSGNLNARDIANVVDHDPLMTVKLLRYVQTHKSPHQLHELVENEQAIMMLGMDTFFEKIGSGATCDAILQRHPEALLHLLNTVKRAQRAAHYAYEWALRLHDTHMEEVRVTALLTHYSEMFMWCFNPVQMLEILHRQEADKCLRSADIQREILGFTGRELQAALTRKWHLPKLLLALTDLEQVENPRVQNVLLAVDLARHSAHDWEDAALPDDYNKIAELLRMDEEQVVALIRKIS